MVNIKMVNVIMDIFSKIAAGEIPSYKCAENEEFYAFLDINPLVKGHTLVIPRREVDYIFDMDDEEIAEFQVFVGLGLECGPARGHHASEHRHQCADAWGQVRLWS